MNKRIPLFEPFVSRINEAPIVTIEEEIPVEVRIDSTKHSEERKFRHSWLNPISNDDIIKTVKQALGTITKNLILDYNDIPQKYHIYSKSNNLNVVGELKRQGEKLVFVVITVMITDKFHSDKESISITI